MSTWEGAGRVKNIFEDADEDKDGQLSKEEELRELLRKTGSNWDDETAKP